MAPRTHITNRPLACLLVGVWAMASLPAYAYWTVVPEDLYPTAQLDARKQLQLQREHPSEELIYTIPFPKHSSLFTGDTKSVLNDVIRQKFADIKIRIAARPDTGPASGVMQGLPRNRALNIRNYLVKSGISASDISIDVENTENPSMDADYSCNIYVTNKDGPRRNRPSLSVTSPQPLAQANPALAADNNVFAQYIAESVQAGRISPEMAVQLLSMSRRAPVAPVTQTNAMYAYPGPRPTAAQPAAPSQPVTQPTPPMPTTWDILESDVTLQKTLERWSQQAGWKVKWIGFPEIRNPGRVTLADRDFLSVADYVLKKAQVAARSAGINMFIKGYSNRVLIISTQEIK